MYKRIITTATLFGILTLSCDAPVTPPPSGCDAMSSGVTRIAAVTAAADFSMANFEIIAADNRAACRNLLDGLHTDHAIRTHGNDIYILERFGKDNIIKFDAKERLPVYQQSLGSGLNIQDIAVISETKAYVSSYHNSDLIIFNPQKGEKISTVDLSRFNTYAGTDSAEAHPFVSALAVYGNYVYAACQRLKTVQSSFGATFEIADTSIIAIIDTRTDMITGHIALHKKNPASMHIYRDKMLASSTGDWFDHTTGGVEMIDLITNQNLGIVAEGSDFGGSVTNVIFVSPNKAYISVGKMSADFSDFWTEIIPFNPTTGTTGAKIAGVHDGFGGMAYDGMYVYAGDRGFGASGIAVINPETNAVSRKIPTNMPPSALAVIFAD